MLSFLSFPGCVLPNPFRSSEPTNPLPSLGEAIPEASIPQQPEITPETDPLVIMPYVFSFWVVWGLYITVGGIVMRLTGLFGNRVSSITIWSGVLLAAFGRAAVNIPSWVVHIFWILIVLALVERYLTRKKEVKPESDTNEPKQREQPVKAPVAAN